jgi:hypothetical protein
MVAQASQPVDAQVENLCHRIKEMVGRFHPFLLIPVGKDPKEQPVTQDKPKDVAAQMEAPLAHRGERKYLLRLYVPGLLSNLGGSSPI